MAVVDWYRWSWNRSEQHVLRHEWQTKWKGTISLTSIEKTRSFFLFPDQSSFFPFPFSRNIFVDYVQKIEQYRQWKAFRFGFCTCKVICLMDFQCCQSRCFHVKFIWSRWLTVWVGYDVATISMYLNCVCSFLLSKLNLNWVIGELLVEQSD